MIYLDLIESNPPSFLQSLNLSILANMGDAVLSILSKQHLIKLVLVLGRKPNPTFSSFHISLAETIERFSFSFEESLLLSILHLTPTLFKQILLDINDTIHAETEPSAETVSLICDFMCENRLYVRDVRDFLLEREQMLTAKQRNNMVRLFDFTEEGEEDHFHFFEYLLRHQEVFDEETKQYGILRYLVWKKQASVGSDPRLAGMIELIEEMIFEYVRQDQTFNRHVAVKDGMSVQMYPSLSELQQNFFWTNSESLIGSQDIKRETRNPLDCLRSEHLHKLSTFSPRVRFALPSLFPVSIFRALLIRTLGQELIQRRLLVPEIVHMVESQFMDQNNGYVDRIDKEKLKDLSQIHNFNEHPTTFTFGSLNNMRCIYYFKRPFFMFSEFDWTLVRVEGLRNSKILGSDEDGDDEEGDQWNSLHFELQNSEDNDSSQRSSSVSFKDQSPDQKPVHIQLKKDFNAPYADALDLLMGMENDARFIYFDELFFNKIK